MPLYLQRVEFAQDVNPGPPQTEPTTCATTLTTRPVSPTTCSPESCEKISEKCSENVLRSQLRKSSVQFQQNETKPRLSGTDFDPKNFVDQVAATDSNGIEIPMWKRVILARQMAEKAQKEAEEKKKVGSFLI